MNDASRPAVRLLREAVRPEAVAVRIDATGQGDFYQVHIDTRQPAALTRRRAAALPRDRQPVDTRILSEAGRRSPGG